jgi:hypothetical protein
LRRESAIAIAIASLTLAAIGCGQQSEPPFGRDAIRVVAAPDSVLLVDLESAGGVLLADLPGDQIPRSRTLDVHSLNPGLTAKLSDSERWRQPTEEDSRTPFHLRWEFYRGRDHVFLHYREPYTNLGELTEGPRPGVELMCLTYGERKWVAEMGLRDVVTEDALSDYERIGAVGYVQ